jgi:hypothetical protein
VRNQIYPSCTCRATFDSSLERGVIGSLLWCTEKSSNRPVVTELTTFKIRDKQNIKVKTKLHHSVGRRTLRQLFRRRRARRHDPMLLLNMSLFNFTDEWSRVFSREHYGRFSS